MTAADDTAETTYVTSDNTAEIAFVTSTEAANKTYGIALTSDRGVYNIAAETAAATRAESEAYARGTYAVALADAHRVYDNAAAQANVEYVAAVMPAVAQKYIEQDSPESVAAYDAAVAAAEDQRNAADKTANVTRVTSIGNALIARETAYGDAEIAYATAVGTARIVYINSSNADEDAYDTSYNTAGTAYENSEAAAENAYNLDIANANRSYVNSLADADEAYSLAMVSPLVNESTALATDATTYLTGTSSGQQARYQTLAGTDSSQGVMNGLYQADIVADWMSGLASVFDTFQTNMAQAEANLDNALTDDQEEESRSIADADVTYLTGSETNAEIYRTGELGLSQAYDTATTHADEQWDVDVATADKELNIDRAEAQKARRIARATAERDYQIALAQAQVFDGSDNSAALQTAEHGHTADLADAEMNYTIDLADADVTWTDAEALADKTETDAWAAAEDTYDVGIAGLDRTYLTSQTTTDNTYENSIAAAESTRITADSTARTLFNTTRATAEETYLTGDYNARLTSLTTLNNTASLPYTTFLVGQATAEQSAWQNVETAYEAETTNINTATTTYDNLVASQTTSLAASDTGAQQTYITTVAPAIEARDDADAAAWELYGEQSAAAEETYQHAVAVAKRDHKVALAHAERDLTVNGDQTAYDNAVATANDESEATKLAAARDYAFAELGAEGQRDISLQSAESTLDSTAGTAEVTKVQTLTSAIHDAEIADATAYGQMLMDVADDLASYNENQSSNLQTQLANLATNDGTPWAKQASARGSAEYNFLVARNGADHTRLNTETTAQVTFTTSEADAWETLINSETGAQLTLLNSQNSALSTYLTSEYGRQQTGISLGIQPVNLYQSFDPNAPVLSSFSTSTTINTASLIATAKPSDSADPPAVTLPPDVDDPEQPESAPDLNSQVFDVSSTNAETDRSYLVGEDMPEGGERFGRHDTSNTRPSDVEGEATDLKRDGFDPATALALNDEPAVWIMRFFFPAAELMIPDSRPGSLTGGSSPSSLVSSTTTVMKQAQQRKQQIQDAPLLQLLADIKDLETLPSEYREQLWQHAKIKYELRTKIQDLKGKTPAADFSSHFQAYKGKDPLREINKARLDELESRLKRELVAEATSRKSIRYELAVPNRPGGAFSGSFAKSAWRLPPGVKVPLSEDEKWRQEQVGFWTETLIMEGAGGVLAQTIGLLRVGKTAIHSPALRALAERCFVAGTPVLTPTGDQPIETFQIGDRVLSRAENDPQAPVISRRVEAVFELSSPVLNIRVGGQLIQATAEHPFFVHQIGWVRAKELMAGDALVGQDNTLTIVSEIEETNETKTVYNLRVAEDHTYFVGSRSWGFSVWVHNAYTYKEIAEGPLKGFFELLDDTGKSVFPGRKLTEQQAKEFATVWNTPKLLAPRPLPNPAWRQSAADSGVLGQRLGIQPGSGQAAHHIVPGTHTRAAPGRAILDRYQIDINAAENGVSLVGGRGAPQNVLPRHHRGSVLHTHDGIDAVNNRLRDAVRGIDDWATGRQAVLDELARIRQGILNGTFP